MKDLPSSIAQIFGMSCLAFSLTLAGASDVNAKVSGTCGTCHTMHNSQDNQTVAQSGEGAGWNGDDGTFNDGTSQNPLGNLLVSDCVGCHSATTDNTIIDLGGNRIPIVFNTNGYPPEPLAGGNFYHVAQGGNENDVYGHNVYGISGIDQNLSAAPGNNQCSGKNTACHSTLAVPPQSDNDFRGGCQGCHYYVYHHEDNINYRFLNSHNAKKGDFTGSGSTYVTGIEEPDWEQANDPTKHNFYKGVNSPGESLGTSHSISSYCGGCHRDFHVNGANGIGDASAWLRHPTDIALPITGEYAAYNPETSAGYSMEAPVAWIDPALPNREEAIVMCLSCHRVHGSEHPDILRWNYDNMLTGEADDDYKDTGCFVCHTTKDE